MLIINQGAKTNEGGELIMRSLFIGMLLVLTVSVAEAQGGPGCGPTPMVPNQQFNQPIMQNPSQLQQQQKQIAVIQAQADFQAATAKLQTQRTISNIQNQGNPQVQAQSAQQFQQQFQQLQQNFQVQMRPLQQ
jgi:hypothetical protein